MTSFKNVVLIALLLGTFSLQNCSSSTPEPTPVQKATKLMVASPWVMNSLTIDGVSDNTFFVGLKITFTSTGFTAVNGEPVWPSSGTWNFKDATATKFIRDDGLTITLDNLTATTMQLTLDWAQTTTGGRAQSVAGKHVFTFSH